MEKVPYMLIVGQKEEESGTVSVRSRDDGDLGSQDLDVFVQKAAAEAKE
jgi:threonyl-tRNA synthetase